MLTDFINTGQRDQLLIESSFLGSCRNVSVSILHRNGSTRLNKPRNRFVSEASKWRTTVTLGGKGNHISMDNQVQMHVHVTELFENTSEIDP
eukprot:766683-Hanusia_phi.AAC.11